MKKNLWIVLLGVLAITACSKDDKPKDPTTPDEGIEITAGDENQTVYADETETPEGIQFTATSAWTADVKASAATRANTVDWVRLLFNGVEKYSGDAGSFTMTVELGENTTGRSRTATITLVCGDTRITITIVQDGRTEEEAQNEESNIGVPAPGSRLVSRITSDGYTTDFTYDAKNRVIKKEQTYTYDDGTISKDVSEIAYTSNGLVIDEYYFMNGQEYERETITLVIGSNGYAISGTEEDEDSSAIWEAEYDAGGYLARHQYDDEGDWIDYTWSGGNITEIGYTEGGISVFEYGDVANNPLCNLDLFGWIISIDVNDSHASLLRLLGKSTAKMPTRGTDWPNLGEHASWSYETDSRGFITKINANNRADYGFNSTDVITITYTDSPPEPPTPTRRYVSRIVTSEQWQGATYDFAYDAQDRLIKVTETDRDYPDDKNIILLSYVGNRVVLTNDDDDETPITLTLGNNGYAVSGRMDDPNANEYEDWNMTWTPTYQNGYLSRFVNDYEDSQIVCDLTWSGGNLTRILTNGQTEPGEERWALEVGYGNVVNPAGCNLDFNFFGEIGEWLIGEPEISPLEELDIFFWLGYYGNRSGNMVESVSTDGEVEFTVDYETDAQGFITKITVTDNEGESAVSTITYK